MDEKAVEILSADVTGLRERLDKMEKDIKGIKQPIEQTLVDLRLLLGELENPFNYIQKFLPDAAAKPITQNNAIDDDEPKQQETFSNTTRRQKEPKVDLLEDIPIPQPVVEPQGIERLAEEASGNDWLEYVNTMLCANILMNIFGSDALEDIMKSYLRKNWITQEVMQWIEDAVDTLMKSNNGLDLNIGLKDVTIEDHFVAIYLLGRLAKNRSDPIFQILSRLISRSSSFKELSTSTSWGRRARQPREQF